MDITPTQVQLLDADFVPNNIILRKSCFFCQISL